ncbi:UDP-N-acetylmuramate dehydrogenase [Pleionea sp. CnH1-48]|uniref:UDP-N-acetylmuramate dehydrogenase n=1 Tax=Pleionea sp. CnH1-48 TaxID=2954494 RepID=UPI00209702DC|nr:UDP-N-acetylmuramate dehydrogenase [Pleionea sp. CnH1-48]MCO7225020.1 UDP-N-acetylmuramate dehydrogenase [Pleionea sp. CnH1-48]
MLEENSVSLKKLNTFGVDSVARTLITLSSDSDFSLLSKKMAKYSRHLIIGAGSNLLFVNDFDGLILKAEINNYEIKEETKDHVLIEAGASDNWHQFVLRTLADGYSGLENLALIPGTVGAAPVQNIGAYGVELEKHFYSLEAYDLNTGTRVTLTKSDCKFGYRDSIFKQEVNRYLILKVTFILNKSFEPVIDYGPLQLTFNNKIEGSYGPIDVAKEVMKIRASKLPDPTTLGNAGSFFKNPVVDKDKLDELKSSFPSLIYYDTEVENRYKLAAGWLIDRLGLRGYRIGDAGVHEMQALVLVNYGRATGQDIYELSLSVQKAVNDTYGINLEPEVRIFR